MVDNKKINQIFGSIRARLTRIETDLGDIQKKLDYLIERGGDTDKDRKHEAVDYY